MADAPTLRMRCTDDDLMIMFDLRERYPHLNESQILRWALHCFHHTPTPPIPMPTPPPRGRIYRAARSAAMRAYLETLDARRKEARNGAKQTID